MTGWIVPRLRSNWMIPEPSAAIFLARYLEARDGPRALSLAAASVAAILAKTERELARIPAQDAIVAPQNVVAAERI